MTTSSTVEVNKDNVLRIGAEFESEAVRLRQNIARYAGSGDGGLASDPALGDPASRDFATALNARLVSGADSYLERARKYADGLWIVAQKCRAAAKAYGYTDDQIAAAYREIGARLDGLTEES